MGTKWKCPNHADNVFQRARRPKNAHVVDSNLCRGYKNDGNIDILDSSDEEQREINTRAIPMGYARNLERPASQRYKPFAWDEPPAYEETQSVKLDFIRAVNDVKQGTLSNAQILISLDELATKSQDIRDGVRNLCYLKFDGTPDVMAANSRTNVELLLQSALCLQSPPPSKKLKSISLPHVPAIKATPSNASTPIQNGRQNTTPPTPSTQGHTTTLRYRKKSGNHANANANATTPTQSNSAHLFLQNTPSRFASSPLENDDTEEIHPSEHANLLAIKQLLEIKGKDALMEFLLPKDVVER